MACPSTTYRLSRLSLLLGIVGLITAAGCGAGDDDDTTADDDDSSPPVEFVLPATVSVRVQIEDVPVEGAIVLQGGTTEWHSTDAEGRASLELNEIPGGEVWVVAALEGHRSVGEELHALPEGEIVLELTSVQTDNADFPYGSAGTIDRGTTEYCSHCHISIVEEFSHSAHSEAARDHQVHDLYAGTAAAWASEEACSEAGGRWLPGTLPGGAGTGDRCYLGVGLLPDAGTSCGAEGQPSCDDPALDPADAPGISGSCADCHAPATPGPLGGGHSLLDAEGVAYEEGVTCDFCHKVASIDAEAPPGIGGRTVLGRPLEEANLGPVDFLPVMYGPYLDVLNPFMGGSYSPIFASGELCSGCHEYEQAPLWDHADTALDPARWPGGTLPVHSTWSEWSGSLHAPDTPCQTCHMPPTDYLNSADLELLDLDPGIAAGFVREPGQVRDHGFYGPLAERPGLPRLLDTAASLSGSALALGDELQVEATVTNFQAGHGLPTGEPLRSMLLIVDARCESLPLVQTAGPALSAVAGAHAVGVIGTDVQLGNVSLFWEGLEAVPQGVPLRLTAFRPTGAFLDYEGVGRFSTLEGGFPAEGKGLPDWAPLGSLEVTLDSSGVVSPGALLEIEAGDVVVLSELYTVPTEGGSAALLSGQAGIDFARVLADAQGAWPVPHHRAVDVLRDNRLLPYVSDTRSYSFAVPEGCTDPAATVYLVYRSYPPRLARERGWASTDHLMGTLEVLVQ